MIRGNILQEHIPSHNYYLMLLSEIVMYPFVKNVHCATTPLSVHDDIKSCF